MTAPMTTGDNSLKRWRDLSRFIQFVLWSGQVKNGRPQSVIVASEPGEGKTELLDRFNTNPTTTYYSDLTYRTIISILRNDVVRGRVTHVVCTEFQKVIARRRSVAESTCTLMLQTMEEGVGMLGFGPQMHDCRMRDGGNSRCGWLLGTTMTSLSKNPYIITELAMDSRAFVVDFTATEGEVQAIEQRMVDGDMSALKKLVLRNVPDDKVTVDVPRNVGTMVKGWVEEMRAKFVRVYGMRTMNRFLHTLRGVALSHGVDVATKAHAEELYRYRSLWLNPPDLEKHKRERGGDNDKR